jgi:predicted membrane channel-forming protein YqfA (hemolysin III family)
MATAIYTLCAVLSLACAGLLLRAWASSRSRLLLWSGLCFVLLAVSNVLLFIDLAVIGDEKDLRWVRSATFLAGTATLLGGLIWDTIGGHER